MAEQVGALQDGWATDAGCRNLLDAIAETARQALADVGGVATVDELAGAVLAVLPPMAAPRNRCARPDRRGIVRLARTGPRR